MCVYISQPMKIKLYSKKLSRVFYLSANYINIMKMIVRKHQVNSNILYEPCNTSVLILSKKVFSSHNYIAKNSISWETAMTSFSMANHRKGWNFYLRKPDIFLFLDNIRMFVTSCSVVCV